MIKRDMAIARDIWLEEAKTEEVRAEREKSDFLKYIDSVSAGGGMAIFAHEYGNGSSLFLHSTRSLSDWITPCDNWCYPFRCANRDRSFRFSVTQHRFCLTIHTSVNYQCVAVVESLDPGLDCENV